MKFRPPCRVRVEGNPGIYYFRRISVANGFLKSIAWKGYVAHIQNNVGSTICEYNRLRPIKEG